jgi:hypothetical protein
MADTLVELVRREQGQWGQAELDQHLLRAEEPLVA